MVAIINVFDRLATIGLTYAIFIDNRLKCFLKIYGTAVDYGRLHDRINGLHIHQKRTNEA
jgi:hypothetical protein